MSDRELAFVSFQPINDGFVASLPLEDVLRSDGDLEQRLKKAGDIYADQVAHMREILRRISVAKKNRTRKSARLVWTVGDSMYRLNSALSKERFQVDGLYEQLVRDVDVPRKWLEKAVILRRYISDVEMIPESLNWGRIEKGTRRAAERMAAGLAPV